MRVRLRRVSRRPRIQWWPAAVFLVWLVLVLIVAKVGARSGVDPGMCNFKRVTGVPCATCGGTRSALRILDGDLAGAFLMNPLLVTGASLALAFLVLRLGFGRTVEFGLTRRERRAGWIIAAVLFALNWAWVIVYVG